VETFIPVVANCMPVSYKWALKCMGWENVGKALMETIHCTLKANLKTCFNYFTIIGEHFILMNLSSSYKRGGILHLHLKE
jgi:hypothetical protein